MKRNFDLIRKIILDIQSLPANTQDACLEYTGEYSQDDVNEHVAILIEAGLVKGKPIRAMGGIIEVSVQSLTWEGHNFAEIAENNVLWKKAISTINEKGGTITFEVLKSLLGSLALKAAGLA